MAPSEMRKVTSNRAKDLAAVISQNVSLCGLMIPGNYLAPGAIEAICTSAKVGHCLLAPNQVLLALQFTIAWRPWAGYGAKLQGLGRERLDSD